MEILAVVENNGAFYGVIIFMSLLILILIGVIYGYVSDMIKGKNLNRIGGTLFAFLVLILFVTLMIFTIKEGKPKTYKAIVTDFNEVYNKGYKVVDQEGKIFILKKVDD